MKRFFFAALCVLATAAQAGVPIEHWVSPTGARVYFVASRSLPMLDVQVDFAAGTAFAAADKAGVAGMTRDLLDAGAGALDEEALVDALTDTGAQLGGSLDLDRAGLTLRSLTSPRELEAALKLMQTVLQQPRFPEAVLSREKTRLIAAIREADTQPGAILSKRFAARLYPAHPYGQDTTEKTVARLARDDLLAFYRQHYCASRAVVSMVGDITRAQAERIAADLTTGLPTGCAEAALPTPALPTGGVVRIDHPSTQSHLAIGMPALRRGTPDFYALTVGNYVLGGGGFVSRLLKEVREKRGYAYSAYSYFAPQAVEGPFQIGLQTKADQVDQALKVARDTLHDFLEKGPTDAELKDAKRNIINGFVLRIDSNRKLLDHLAVIGFYRLPLDYLDTYPARVEQVTAAQIRQAFARYVKPEHLVTVIVGPVPQTAAAAAPAAGEPLK